MESGANTKEVLTPKNVYRFLTDNLPGLYPHGVIPAAERKGLTLVKFWAQVLDGIIPPEWHASLFGGTQRSRRLSDMMNRTGVQPLPPKLQQEMNALLSGETLIRLSQQVQDCMKPEHEQVFENLQKSRETLPRTFVDMLTLSWLVLLAFYGPEMGSRELLDFCHAQEHSAQALYLLSSHVTFGRRVPLSMTGRNCELCRQGLSKDEYVMDAASCLPQLTDAIRQGGKIAVTGMGCIGKTEMTRQALALLAKEELFSRMAWVQYEKSLTASLRMAFDGLDGVAEENVLSTVREKLEAPYQGRTLLLIDSVDMPPEADEGLREIEHWGCDVLGRMCASSTSGQAARDRALGLRCAGDDALPAGRGLPEYRRAAAVGGSEPDAVCPARPVLEKHGQRGNGSAASGAFARGGASAGDYPAGASGEDEALDDASAAGRA